MKIRNFFSVCIFLTVTIALFHSTNAQEGILIAYGDHIELVCEESGLVSVTHTILETANTTQNVTSVSTYSIKGTLVGEVRSEYDPEIREPDILYKSENGITTIIANFSVSLAPLKFVKLELFYKLSDMLKNENGTWHLRYTFNTDAISPPEIVVKIPKPSQFNKLIVENTVPSPNVFIEESHFYSFVYKVPLFKFGNTSTTSIDISYRTALDPDAIFWFLILSIASFGLGVVLTSFGKQIKGRLGLRKKRHEPRFEIFKDKEGEFRFRLKAPNCEIIASSESYKTRRECLRGIESVRTYALDATTSDTFH